MKDIIERISGDVNYHTREGSASHVVMPGIKADFHELSKEHFHVLRRRELGKQIAFIDGGSSDIMATPTISITFVRIAGVIYRDTDKESTKKKEYFVVTRIENDDKLKFKTKVYPLDNSAGSVFTFNLDDPTLQEGVHHATSAKVGGVVRRFLEITFAKELVKEMEEHSIIVLDGSLQCSYTGEDKLIASLVYAAKDNNVLVAALAKSVSLLTDSGVSATIALRQMQTHPMWYYHPLADLDDPSYRADVYIVKLHQRTSFLFKLDISDAFSSVDPAKIIGYLAYLAIDPVFLGYPYGLIKVDELARVKNDETNHLRMRFLKHADIESLELDAHAILDSIKF
ncbi:MAG: DNA double-strand break repair nuclease NurA [Nanoarchaeota archaeon]